VYFTFKNIKHASSNVKFTFSVFLNLCSEVLVNILLKQLYLSSWYHKNSGSDESILGGIYLSIPPRQCCFIDNWWECVCALNHLWVNDISSKVLIFGWRLSLETLPTRMILSRKGIIFFFLTKRKGIIVNQREWY
jgi:hypothetical protein